LSIAQAPEPCARAKAQEHDAATGSRGRGRGRATVVTHRTGRGGLRDLAVVVVLSLPANPDRASAEGAQRAASALFRHHVGLALCPAANAPPLRRLPARRRCGVAIRLGVQARQHGLSGFVVRILGDELAAGGFGREGAMELMISVPTET